MKKTIIDLFETSVEQYGAKTFLLEKRHRKFEPTTYAETKEQALEVGAGLASTGIRPGDKVVVESSTRAILAVTWLVYMLPVVFFLLGYFLSAGLTEGWRYAVAIAAAAVSFIPIKLYDGYARKRDTLTYTIVREF